MTTIERAEAATIIHKYKLPINKNTVQILKNLRRGRLISDGIGWEYTIAHARSKRFKDNVALEIEYPAW